METYATVESVMEFTRKYSEGQREKCERLIRARNSAETRHNSEYCSGYTKEQKPLSPPCRPGREEKICTRKEAPSLQEGPAQENGHAGSGKQSRTVFSGPQSYPRDRQCRPSRMLLHVTPQDILIPKEKLASEKPEAAELHPAEHCADSPQKHKDSAEIHPASYSDPSVVPDEKVSLGNEKVNQPKAGQVCAARYAGGEEAKAGQS